MKPGVILLGSGGHAKVIIEILEERTEFAIAGCTGPALDQRDTLGYPFLGDDSILAETLASGTRHVFVAVGDNRVRSKLLKHVQTLGFDVISAVSERAIVSPRAMIGRSVAIMPGAIVNVGATIGDGAIINTGAVVDHDCSIGRCAHIAPGVTLAGGVQVAEGAFLGIGCKVIPGIRIGEWSVVGAGAVVIRDIPANLTAVGVPAVVRVAE